MRRQEDFDEDYDDSDDEHLYDLEPEDRDPDYDND